MKNVELQKNEINKLRDDYQKLFPKCNASSELLRHCAQMYQQMDAINQKNGYWDARKGYDAEAIYYVAEYAVRERPDLAVEVLKEHRLGALKMESKEEEIVVNQFAAALYDYMINSKKIQFHVIEPHPDDALGSACGICYNQNVITTLHTLTISSDQRDAVVLDSEGRKKYQSIKKAPNIIRHERYMLQDLHYDLRITDEQITYSDKISKYQGMYHEIEQLKKVVESIVLTAKKENAYIALPMGLEHPMHILTMITGLVYIEQSGFSWDRVVIYVDHPYDNQLIGTDRALEVREFLKGKMGQQLLRCDDLGATQADMDPVVREVYGENHYGEFAGTLGKTYCSYYITEFAYKELETYFHLQYNRILFISAQAWPFFKTGGLGEVAYSYCKALQSSVDDVRILIPGYCEEGETRGTVLDRIAFHYERRDAKYKCILEERKYDGLIYYFLHMWDPRGEHISFSKPEKNGEEFALFCDAILQVGLNSIDYLPTICHCNDWQTALIPFLKKTKYRSYRRDMKVVYTIHFYGYKGIFPKKEIFSLLNLNKEHCQLCISCRDDCVLDRTDLLNESAKAELVQTPPSLMSFMRAGIEFADAVTTVSKGYAEEIQGYTDFRSIKVTGIRNGILPRGSRPGHAAWEDASGKANGLHNFEYLLVNKKASKEALQKNLGLEVSSGTPILCMVSRLAIEKGINLVNTILPYMLSEEMQIVIIGDDADKERQIYAKFFKDVEQKNKGKFAYREYSERLEFETYAAADILLMPSLSEACGTTQMLAMQYGVVPIVSMLQSFKDTVLDFKNLKERETKYWDKGIGFYAYVDDCWVLLEVMKKAIEVYREDKETWRKTMKYCFGTDFSWRNGSIFAYLKLYDGLWQT